MEVAPRWVQIPEPENPVFYGVLPSTQRIWLQLSAPVHRNVRVCVDLKPDHRGALFEVTPGQWWWNIQRYHELLRSDPEFKSAVNAAACVPMPAAQWPPVPSDRRSATLVLPSEREDAPGKEHALR